MNKIIEYKKKHYHLAPDLKKDDCKGCAFNTKDREGCKATDWKCIEAGSIWIEVDGSDE